MSDPNMTQPDYNTENEQSLTPRQKEIIQLLHAGKVNKEVAELLGISLGTVKQHLVTIFKKLNVSNRTMAVSKTLTQENSILKTNHIGPEDFESHLERRPCIMLSLLIPQTCSESQQATFKEVIQTIHNPHDSFKIDRKTHLCEFIYGLDQSNELATLYALAFLQSAYKLLRQKDVDLAKNLTAIFAADMMIASIARFGGWTEDVLAGTLIGKTRTIGQKLNPGTLFFDQSFKQLLLDQKINLDAAQNDSQLFSVQLEATADINPITGHEKAFNQIQSLFQKNAIDAPVLLLEGYKGIGKTYLVRQFIAQANLSSNNAAYFRVVPEKLEGLFNYTQGIGHLMSCLNWIIYQDNHYSSVKTLVIEDIHLLNNQAQEVLLFNLQKFGYSALLTSQTKTLLSSQIKKCFQIKIENLAEDLMQTIAFNLAQKSNNISKKQRSEAIKLAHGVPLFLRHLLFRGQMGISFSLILTIMTKIDRLKVDRIVLNELVHRHESPVDLKKNQPPSMQENFIKSLNHLIDSGILTQPTSKTIQFAHPLIPLILKEVFIAKNQSNMTEILANAT